MKLSRDERELLMTLMSLAQKLLAFNHHTPANGAGPSLLVKDIAEELGVIPSFVYQLHR